jgi:hypothetical protein
MVEDTMAPCSCADVEGDLGHKATSFFAVHVTLADKLKSKWAYVCLGYKRPERTVVDGHMYPSVDVGR